MAERDLDEVLRRMSQTKVNRRGFLAAAGLTGAAAALAACSRAAGRAQRPRRRRRRLGCGAIRGRVAETPAPSFEIEKELFMYNWAAYVSPKNMDAFKARVRRRDVHLRRLRQQRGAHLQAPGRGDRLRHRSPDRGVRPAAWWRRASSRSWTCRGSRTSRSSTRRSRTCGGIPTNEYQVPKDYGTTGILYRKSLISKIPQSWREFYEMIKGEASGKTVFVDSMGDVFVFPLKMLGYSLNTVEKTELDAAREILLEVAPHLYALDSNEYGFKMKDGTSVLTLGWTGPLGQELADEKGPGEAGYVVPSEGTLFWLDTWVMLADAPHPNAAYAWLELHPRARDPGRGDELQPVRDPERRGQGVRQRRTSCPIPRSSRPTT